ncbi:MAG: hypothetical protein ALECFALPRED_003639 [Alectoria fallacina]|uniref:F-box domain-containing protein n=1 Tax=Alectoria fallacina TaxID=1903189 RepID=A0A8H3FM95_9LECA|nr:MAG: hypothetical protein ALECFALPRED_003639 [Alectoria fallacina]
MPHPLLPPLLTLPFELKQEIFHHLSHDGTHSLPLPILRHTHPIFRHAIPRQKLSPITPNNRRDLTITQRARREQQHPVRITLISWSTSTRICWRRAAIRATAVVGFLKAVTSRDTAMARKTGSTRRLVGYLALPQMLGLPGGYGV